MTEINTTEIMENEHEVGGQWACIVACVGGCAAAEVVIPGGIALSAFATAASAL